MPPSASKRKSKRLHDSFFDQTFNAITSEIRRLSTVRPKSSKARPKDPKKRHSSTRSSSVPPLNRESFMAGGSVPPGKRVVQLYIQKPGADKADTPPPPVHEEIVRSYSDATSCFSISSGALDLPSEAKDTADGGDFEGLGHPKEKASENNSTLRASNVEVPQENANLSVSRIGDKGDRLVAIDGGPSDSFRGVKTAISDKNAAPQSYHSGRPTDFFGGGNGQRRVRNQSVRKGERRRIVEDEEDGWFGGWSFWGASGEKTAPAEKQTVRGEKEQLESSTNGDNLRGQERTSTLVHSHRVKKSVSFAEGKNEGFNELETEKKTESEVSAAAVWGLGGVRALMGLEESIPEEPDKEVRAEQGEMTAHVKEKDENRAADSPQESSMWSQVAALTDGLSSYLPVGVSEKAEPVLDFVEGNELTLASEFPSEAKKTTTEGSSTAQEASALTAAAYRIQGDPPLAIEAVSEPLALPSPPEQDEPLIQLADLSNDPPTNISTHPLIDTPADPPSNPAADPPSNPAADPPADPPVDLPSLSPELPADNLEKPISRPPTPPSQAIVSSAVVEVPPSFGATVLQWWADAKASSSGQLKTPPESSVSEVVAAESAGGGEADGERVGDSVHLGGVSVKDLARHEGHSISMELAGPTNVSGSPRKAEEDDNIALVSSPEVIIMPSQEEHFAAARDTGSPSLIFQAHEESDGELNILGGRDRMPAEYPRNEADLSTSVIETAVTSACHKSSLVEPSKERSINEAQEGGGEIYRAVARQLVFSLVGHVGTKEDNNELLLESNSKDTANGEINGNVGSPEAHAGATEEGKDPSAGHASQAIIDCEDLSESDNELDGVYEAQATAFDLSRCHTDDALRASESDSGVSGGVAWGVGQQSEYAVNRSDLNEAHTTLRAVPRETVSAGVVPESGYLDASLPKSMPSGLSNTGNDAVLTTFDAPSPSPIRRDHEVSAAEGKPASSFPKEDSLPVEPVEAPPKKEQPAAEPAADTVGGAPGALASFWAALGVGQDSKTDTKEKSAKSGSESEPETPVSDRSRADPDASTNAANEQALAHKEESVVHATAGDPVFLADRSYSVYGDSESAPRREEVEAVSSSSTSSAAGAVAPPPPVGAADAEVVSGSSVGVSREQSLKEAILPAEFAPPQDDGTFVEGVASEKKSNTPQSEGAECLPFREKSPEAEESQQGGKTAGVSPHGGTSLVDAACNSVSEYNSEEEADLLKRKWAAEIAIKSTFLLGEQSAQIHKPRLLSEPLLSFHQLKSTDRLIQSSENTYRKNDQHDSEVHPWGLRSVKASKTPTDAPVSGGVVTLSSDSKILPVVATQGSASSLVSGVSGRTNRRTPLSEDPEFRALQQRVTASRGGKKEDQQARKQKLLAGLGSFTAFEHTTEVRNGGQGAAGKKEFSRAVDEPHISQRRRSSALRDLASGTFQVRELTSTLPTLSSVSETLERPGFSQVPSGQSRATKGMSNQAEVPASTALSIPPLPQSMPARHARPETLRSHQRPSGPSEIEGSLPENQEPVSATDFIPTNRTELIDRVVPGNAPRPEGSGGSDRGGAAPEGEPEEEDPTGVEGGATDLPVEDEGRGFCGRCRCRIRQVLLNLEKRFPLYDGSTESAVARECVDWGLCRRCVLRSFPSLNLSDACFECGSVTINDSTLPELKPDYPLAIRFPSPSGRVFPSGFHVYAAHMFVDGFLKEAVRRCRSADEVVALATDPAVQENIRPDWGSEGVKLQVMYAMCAAKTEQHACVRHLLLRMRRAGVSKVVSEDPGAWQQFAGRVWLALADRAATNEQLDC